MNDKVPESLSWLAASGEGAAVPAEFQPVGYVPALVRRFTGDGLINLLCAKAEVESRIRSAGGALPAALPLEDALRPEAIPSIARGRREDRLLAEIDQDGFAFAEDPIDAPFFDRRADRRPPLGNASDPADAVGPALGVDLVRALSLQRGGGFAEIARPALHPQAA